MARSFSDEEVKQYAIPAPSGARSFSDEDIAALEVKAPTPEKAGPAGFFPGVARAFGERTKRQEEALGRSIDNEQTLGSGLLQAAGEGAGFLAGDIPLEALKAVTPDFIEKPAGELIKKGVEKAATLIPQSVKDTIAEHPEAARNVEAVANIAGLVPGGAVLGTGAKAGSKVLTGTAKTVAKNVTPSPTGFVTKRTAAFSELFNSTVKTRREYNRMQEKGHDVALTLASDDRYVPTGKNGGITEGKITPDGQIANIQSDIDAVAPMIRQVIESENKYVPLENIRKQITSEIAPLKLRGDEYNRVLANITRDLDFYEQTYGRDGMIPLTILDDIKKEKYRNINWNNPDLLTADRSIARAARKTIEGEVTDISVAGLNRELGKLYDAQEMLETLAGRAVKGGRLGKHFARVIGVGVGSSGGLTGAFFGGVFADRLVDAMQSASFGNPMAKAIIGEIKRTRPEIFRKAEELLAQRAKDRSTRLQLPAPTSIPMGAGRSTAVDSTRVFDDYDAFLAAQGIERGKPDMLALPPGKASPLNQGRAIPLLPRGSSIEAIGPGLTGGRYVPPSPAPKGTPTRPITPSEPYVPAAELPVIDAGKRAPSTLPVAKDAPKVFAPSKDDVYAYHYTNPKNADGILKEGIKPGTTGSIYYAPNQLAAEGYGGGTPMKLRVKRSAIGEHVEDYGELGGSSRGEIKANKAIPPESIEVFKDGKWEPLLKVKETSIRSNTDPKTNQLVDPEPGIVYYHGTSKENKASILENGIDTKLNKKGYAEQPEAFYVGDETEAGMYNNEMLGVRAKPGETVKTLSISEKEYGDVVGRSSSIEETAAGLRELRRRGYDAVNHGDEIEILNPAKFEAFDPKAETPAVPKKKTLVSTNMTKAKEAPKKNTVAGKKFYHATLEDFEEFDMSKAGMNSEWDNAKFGIFFTDNKAQAMGFPELTRKPGDKRTIKTKEVQLDIKNPIDLTFKGIFSKKEQAPVIVEILTGEKMSPKAALSYIDENVGPGEMGDLQEGLYGDIANKKIMQDAGYDGIISTYGTGDDGKEILEYAVFDTSQIKKKVNNPLAPKKKVID